VSCVAAEKVHCRKPSERSPADPQSLTQPLRGMRRYEPGQNGCLLAACTPGLALHLGWPAFAVVFCTLCYARIQNKYCVCYINAVSSNVLHASLQERINTT